WPPPRWRWSPCRSRSRSRSTRSSSTVACWCGRSCARRRARGARSSSLRPTGTRSCSPGSRSEPVPRPGPTVTHLSEAEIAADSRSVLGRIARLLRPYRAKMAAVGGIVVSSAILTAIVPFLTQAVFDHALFGEGGPDLGLLGWLVAGMCALPILASMLNIAQNWLTSTIGNSAMADLRSELFAHLQKMELAFFTTTKTGAIQSRLANDVAGVRTVLTDTATSIVQNTVTVTAAFVSMVILSWELAILTVILMPLFVWLQLKVGRRRQV